MVCRPFRGFRDRPAQALVRVPDAEFGFVQVQVTFTQHQPVGDADELGIGKQHARPRMTVVVEHFHAQFQEPFVKLRHGRAQPSGFVLVDRHHHHLEGGHGERPADAPRVVMLFDGGRDDAAYADAVATHLQGTRLAGRVQHHGTQGRAVLGAELENMSYLDAARDAQAPAPRGRLVGLGQAQHGRMRFR